MNDFENWLPSDRKYDSSTYMWAQYDSTRETVFVGAGQPTINSLGELAYLSLAEPGSHVQRGNSAGSMEAAKMTGEVLTPVSGKVLSVNDKVLENPDIVNKDPYDSGWLLEIAPDSWTDEQIELYDSGALYEHLPEELRGSSASIAGH